jgi:hypothetical protein
MRSERARTRTCVGGFDAKYFKGKGWEEQAEQLSAIYRRVLEPDGYGLAP